MLLTIEKLIYGGDGLARTAVDAGGRSMAVFVPFVLPGEEWFALNDEKAISWATIQSTLDSEQQRLAQLIASVETVTTNSPLAATERFNLILGIACHAIYHAGQVQLIKRLRTSD